MKYVVIGNSTAAIGCVEGIRGQDKQGEIVILSDEPYHTYSRPLISYLLCGKTNRQRMKYRKDAFYAENGCRKTLGVRVQKIDSREKMVTLQNGEQVVYDKLLIATGSRPFIPDTPGYEDVDNKFTFMKLDDALALEQTVTPDSRVLIVGAGLIGLKCAEGIYGKAAGITVIDLAERVLPSILDEEGAAAVQSHLGKAGIRFILGTKADRFLPHKTILSNGKEVGFDILIMAAGVRPNVELFDGEVNRGIVVNEKGETSIPDIYAAGDCAEGMDISIGRRRVLALLPNAYMQGECAGINMAGGICTYAKGMPMNAIGLFGLHIVTAGNCDGQVYASQENGGYKKLFVKDGRLAGYMIIGDVRRAGIYTAMVREQTPLQDIDFELVREKPQLMAFSRKTRQHYLGGAV